MCVVRILYGRPRFRLAQGPAPPPFLGSLAEPVERELAAALACLCHVFPSYLTPFDGSRCEWMYGYAGVDNEAAPLPDAVVRWLIRGIREGHIGPDADAE